MHSTPFRPRSSYCYVLLLAGLALLPATTMYGGFYVDDYEIGDVGSCNLDNWVSFASNHDFMAGTSPSCVVRLGVPVEIGTEVQRSRENGEWKSSGAVSGKVTLLPMTNGVGIGLSAESDWDLLNGASTGGNINVPVTFDLGHGLHLHVNGGWLYDATTKTNYATWGSRVAFNVTPTVALIGEVFGQAGPRGESVSITEPRFQTGIRFSPASNLDVTVIYGRNLNGENANWLTLGFNIGFDPH
jgi:hypothetical protein